MEGILHSLQLLAIFGIGLFAIYQCFEIGQSGFFARPVAGWSLRFALIAIAAVCFFVVARIAATH